MTSFRYRALATNGEILSGLVDAASSAEAVVRVRRLGGSPIEIAAAPPAAAGLAKPPPAKVRQAVNKTLGELAVLLNAGLSLDRAMAMAIENMEHPPTRLAFEDMLREIREGVPLARAMARRGTLFPVMAQAMVEAGEANGRLGPALERVTETLERAESLRQLVSSSMIYPIALMVIATGVILLMLLFVVPQFENVFASSTAKLPPASMAVMAASRFLRDYGWILLLVIGLATLGTRRLLRQSGVRAAKDRLILRVPQLGPLVSYGQTAVFARIMSALVDGGVPLPVALGMAQRSISNTYMAAAISRVASGLKEGGGLTAPLAAANIFPRLAIGFLRTGEETSQLGLMLGRLADVLDREVRIRLQRVIGVLTPAITVLLGVTVGGIIAAMMSAILGFNDLAVTT